LNFPPRLAPQSASAPLTVNVAELKSATRSAYFSMRNTSRAAYLVASQTDKTTLTAIISGDEQPREHSIKVMQNFALFEELLADCKDDYTAVCNGLAKLSS
jgi:hypothetical protein